MTAARIYIDEDVHHYIASALRLRGWEALTTLEAGRSGTSDPEQIKFASVQGYALLSYNVRDFARIHYELMASGQTHTGIIVGSRQQRPAANLRALLRLLSALSAEHLHDQLVYLNNWA